MGIMTTVNNNLNDFHDSDDSTDEKINQISVTLVKDSKYKAL